MNDIPGGKLASWSTADKVPKVLSTFLEEVQVAALEKFRLLIPLSAGYESYAIIEWVELGEVYPPARTAIERCQGIQYQITVAGF